MSLSIRKEPGSGSSNGKWYLHVIGTYDTTGAEVYHSVCVDFGTVSSPAAGSTKPVLTVSANNAAWAMQRTITIQASGAETLAYRRSGESTWKTLAVTAKSVNVTENGYYTFKLTAGDDTITRSIQVEKIDRVNPTASIGAPLESGMDKTAKEGVYTKITLPVTYADRQSGVKKIEYAWTNSSVVPASSAWKALATGTSQIAYTATESTETAKYLHLKVTDNVSLTYTTKSSAYKVIGQSAIDKRAPGITLTGEPTKWTNDMVTLEWALQDYAGKNYEVILPDGRTVRAGANSGEIWAPRNGTYTVKVRDTDYGKENTATLEITQIDKTAPSVTVSGGSIDWTGSGQKFNLSVSDSESGVGKKYIKIVDADEEKPTEGLEELTTNQVTVDQEGVWYVYYKIYDNAGDDAVGREANKSEGFIGPVKIDLETPKLTVTYGNTGVSKSEGLTLSMKAEYGISGGTVKAGEDEISELTVLPEDIDAKTEKETDYLVTEQGSYQFTLRSGSGKTDTAALNVYEAAFETSIDTEVETQLVVENGKLIEPEMSGITGYTCEGWYTARTGGSLWNFETDTVSENMMLYARLIDKTPPDAPVLQDGITLPTTWTNAQKTIPLALHDGICVTELWVSIDGSTYEQVTDFDNNTQEPEINYNYAGVVEGEHTYRFMAKDAAGNESSESTAFKVMLDEKAPEIGELIYENKAADLWQWIIGKTSLIIHVPVTDEGGGVEKISYTMTPTDASGNPDSSKEVTKTTVATGGEAKITFDEDFRGKIVINCVDIAGNAADSVTIGTSGTSGVIVEDKAPVISVLADRGIADTSETHQNGIELADEFYESAPAVIVTVKDDIDNAVTAGIATVAYQVGEDGTRQPVTVDTSTLQAAAQAAFTIPASEIPMGITAIRVYATDNAGNETVKGVTVKVKKPEKQPAAEIDYREEELTGLVPNGKYRIGVITDGGEISAYQEITADEEGRIPIDEDWFGKDISIIKKGNGSETGDSTAQSLNIPARPAQPTPTGVDVNIPGGTGKLIGLTSGTTYEISTDGGSTWEIKTADESGEITGLAPGTYTVRVKAGDSNFASEASDPVKIDAYKITVTFMANGENYKILIVDYGETLTNIPSVPPKKDAGDQIYMGEWCMDEQGNSPADFTDIKADMTVYAVYTRTYTVTLQGGTGYTLSAQDGSISPVKEGGSFAFRFQTDSGYRTTGSFAIKVNDVKVNAAAGGTGIYTYTITDIREDKTVTVEGVKKKGGAGGSPDKDQEPGAGDDPGKEEGTGPQPTPPEPPKQPDPPADTPKLPTPSDPSKPSPSPADTPKPGTRPGSRPGTTPAAQEGKKPGETGKEQPPAGEPAITDGGKSVTATVDNGRIVTADEPLKTGNVKDMASTSSTLRLGNGVADGDGKCGLCHICPTFLGICYFIWLAIILAVLVIGIAVWRKKRRKEQKEEK